MEILVMLNNGVFKTLASDEFNRLLELNQIRLFERSGGLVWVDEDPMRERNSLPYSGLGRRDSDSAGYVNLSK